MQRRGSLHRNGVLFSVSRRVCRPRGCARCSQRSPRPDRLTLFGHSMPLPRRVRTILNRPVRSVMTFAQDNADASEKKTPNIMSLDVARSATGSHPKMAEELAYKLESLVMDRGWPIGQILGSEPDLIEKFGVSRAVFREAVRIVEHHGAARMRRGPKGGLIVTAPDLRAVQRPTTLWLDYANVSTGDL